MSTTGDPHTEAATQEFSVLPALLVTAGAHVGATVLLRGDKASIGRGISSDVHIDDSHVSRRHAVLRRDDGDWWIEDARSTSGTYVNGVAITGPKRVQAGDRIRIGTTELSLVVPGTGAHRDVTPAPTAAPTAVVQPPHSEPGGVHLGAQRAHTIHNVGRDQYVHNQLALRIAPMRRRARRLLWLGLTVIFVSTAAAIVDLALSAQAIEECFAGDPFDDCVPGPSTFLVFPLAMLAELVGMALVISSLLMRRRADREERAL